ncbi:transposase [Pandoraea cepalis]|uniref:transposase n=1 Tax=Pandoraea cepalis TaxID=2508294 RepID=UPI003F5BECA3
MHLICVRVDGQKSGCRCRSLICKRLILLFIFAGCECPILCPPTRSRFSLVLLSGNIVRHGILNLNKNTCYAWRKQFGDMISDDVKRIKALETENARLKTFDSGYFFVPVRRPICSLPP